MNRKFLLALAAGCGLANAGCFINQYSSEPNVRVQQLLNQSENLRQMGGFWRRFWLNDQPSHLAPDVIDGGIRPR